MGSRGTGAHGGAVNSHLPRPRHPNYRPASPPQAESPTPALAPRAESPRIIPAPTHEEVSAQAAVLWRQAGCPEGKDLGFWLQAEHQLRETARTPLQDQKTTAP